MIKFIGHYIYAIVGGYWIGVGMLVGLKSQNFGIAIMTVGFIIFVWGLFYFRKKTDKKKKNKKRIK